VESLIVSLEIIVDGEVMGSQVKFAAQILLMVVPLMC